MVFGSISDMVGQSVRLGGRDALLIVPPFAGIDRPSLGVHILQAEAQRVGIRISVIYANLLFANRIGKKIYNSICYGATTNLVGESCFRAAAFPELSQDNFEEGGGGAFKRVTNSGAIALDEIERISRTAQEWSDEIAAAISVLSVPIVGCTSTFEQTCSSVAILGRLKGLDPSITTILGGANCEGNMAHGIAELDPRIDYIFSGESEHSFVNFMQTVLAGGRPPKRVIASKPNSRLDEVATPDFTEFYDQLRRSDPEFLPETIWLPYESSRGCWWGEKHHCTFCGINGEGMSFRQKTPDTVLRELGQLTARHVSNRVLMVDNIMPHKYFATLLPRLASELPGLHLFYEQKSNLNLSKVQLISQAGVAVIQPGIEALSTPLLKLMKKGVRAAQNIALLRYARSTGLRVNWNLLHSFPGDLSSWYEDTVVLMRVITHLEPASGLYRLSIDRFSPYFNDPEAHGMVKVRPIPAYGKVFPPRANLPEIAYHFQADYESGSMSDHQLIERLKIQLTEWQSLWEQAQAPQLHVTELSPDTFILRDSRRTLGKLEVEFINREQAKVCLVGEEGDANMAAVSWALDRASCIAIDGELVPLATASPELMGSFG